MPALYDVCREISNSREGQPDIKPWKNIILLGFDVTINFK